MDRSRYIPNTCCGMHSTHKKRTSTSVDNKKHYTSMTEKQRSIMLEFLSEHPSMVRDRSVGGIPVSSKTDRDEKWEELASILNQCESGAQKDSGGWRRSWQDLKRYESLKAKKSMFRQDKTNRKIKESPVLELSPLQEKIANLLKISITDMVADYEEGEETSDKAQVRIEPSTSFESKDASCNRSTNTNSEIKVAEALQSIATALAERNIIEERKLKIFEDLLKVYAAKNGVGISETVYQNKCG